MNGPFSFENHSSCIYDASGFVVARGMSFDGGEEKQKTNTLMVCNALNAAYYMSQPVKDEE